MKTIQKPIAECTAAELRAFATESCGLDISASSNRAQIVAKLSTVWEKDFITVVQVERAEHPPVPTAQDDEYVTVVIAKSEEAGGDQPVWVSVNGRGLWIERGKPQRIHKRYEHVLKNAVRTVYDQVPASNGQPGDMVPRDVPSYPYTVIPTAA